MSLDTKIGENLHSLSKILYDAAKKEFPLWEKAERINKKKLATQEKADISIYTPRAKFIVWNVQNDAAHAL